MAKYLDDNLARMRSNNGRYFKDDGNVVNIAEYLETMYITCDKANRQSHNTVFGEKIVGVRKPSIASQFQYPVVAGKVTVVQLNGGTIAQVGNLLVGSTGTNAAGEASITTRETVRYFPGNEAYCFFTARYTIGVANSLQQAGLFNGTDGFFIGYSGINFGVGRLRSGVEYFVNQADFNIDTIDGNGKSGFDIDPTKINVFCITYGYLGAANITYSVLSEDNSWIPFHIIKYANSSEETHIANSYLPVRGMVKNTGNITNIVLATASIAAGIVDGGNSQVTTRMFNYSRQDVIIAPTEQVIFALRSKTTFGSMVNSIASSLCCISTATELSRNAVIKIYKNPTITNTPTWADIDTASSVEVSTNITITYGTGKSAFILNIAKSADKFLDLDFLDARIFPGDYWVATIATPTGTNGDFNLALNWKELF